MPIIQFDSGTTLDTLRLVGNTPSALGECDFIPEMGIALSDNQTPLRRAYALGYVKGCMVGFGVESALTLREAETVWCAEPLSFDNLVRRHAQLVEDAPWSRQWSDEKAQAVALASGVLRGYKDSTVYLADAYECVSCERRVVRDLDPYEQCLDGFFCAAPDCFTEFGHSRDCREDRS